MSDQPKPYMAHVAHRMDMFINKAKALRAQAQKLVTQAEVWEDAAGEIE